MCRGVNHPLGRDAGQFAGLADASDALALDKDGAVPDNPTLGINGDEESGVFDFQRRWRVHDGLPPCSDGGTLLGWVDWVGFDNGQQGLYRHHRSG